MSDTHALVRPATRARRKTLEGMDFKKAKSG